MRYPNRLKIGPVSIGDAVLYGAAGSAAWYNPDSASDRRLLFEWEQAVLETDCPKVLRASRQSDFAPHHQFLIYQAWRPEVQPGVRPVGAMNPALGKEIGEALAGGPTQHLVLVTGGFMSGSLAALGESLAGHKLQTLGLCWHFSGDDITDDLELLPEIMSLCTRCQVERLTVLTGAMSEAVEERLVFLLKDTKLKQIRIAEKDDDATYPLYQTAKLDQALKSRSSSPH